MIKTRFVNRIKYNRKYYSLYYHILNSVINIGKPFVRTDYRTILFNSYAGRKFDDSPRVIYEGMLKDHRFDDYRIFWAFHNPEDIQELPKQVRKIRTDSLKYFLIAIKAGVWITNSSIERGLNFKKRKTLYFNTWHGTPMKKMGADITQDTDSFTPKRPPAINVMMAQSDFEAEVFSRMFQLSESSFLKAGLPRNDILFTYTEKYRNELREKLGISEGKKVILYCPTFREFEKDENNGCVLLPPIDLAKWEKELAADYVLLFRAHYEVAKVMDIQENDFVRNMTDYPVLNDLMIASDLLISDYSSVFFDYSIMDKPMLHFTYDYDKYAAKRGMYFDIRDYLSGSDNEDGVIRLLKDCSLETETKKTKDFRNQFVKYYGHATEAALDCIASYVDGH